MYEGPFPIKHNCSPLVSDIEKPNTNNNNLTNNDVESTDDHKPLIVTFPKSKSKGLLLKADSVATKCRGMNEENENSFSDDNSDIIFQV